MSNNKEITIEKGKFVTLKARELVNGFSLFLVYYHNQKRKKENLTSLISTINKKKMTLQDKDILRFAMQRKAELDLNMSKNADEFIDNMPQKIFLTNYIDILLKRIVMKSNTKKKYPALVKHIKNYCPDDIYLFQITEKWLDGFKTHLLTYSDEEHKVLARNTSDRYFSLFKTILNYAEKDKLINKNVGRYIKGIGKDSSLPKFLTIDEIKLLDSLPYESVFDVKNAFLFACFTGLRYSDIVNLKWSDLSLEGDEKSLRIKQIKTEVEILIPLPIQALKYLPKEKSIDLNVFKMPNNDHTNKHLNKWKADSLSKNLTFHMARHSYGTNLYNLSNDIYITSNLMGHTDIRHTQRYARVLNSTKTRAINNMPVF